MVRPMAYAAIAAGADDDSGSPSNPAKALSDGPQSLTPENYLEVMNGIYKLAGFMREEGLAIDTL